MSSHSITTGRGLALWLALLLLSSCNLPPFAAQLVPTAPPGGTEPAGRPAQPSPPRPAATASQPVTAAPSPSPAGRDLPFETIERSDYSQFYQLHPTEPQHIYLITSAAEASQLTGWVSPQAQQKLAQLDYGQYFVIALFRGHLGSSGYDTVIQRVSRQGDRLTLHVEFWAPSPYYAVTAASTSPHHVVKVLRDGGPLEEAELQVESQQLTPTPPADIRRLTPTPSH